MKGLIIDTTIKESYVAAFDGTSSHVVYLRADASTASALVPAVRKALSALAIENKALDGIAAVVGPGSFTGIRIGVSFANAFAFALGIPRFRFTAFDLMQEAAPSAPAYAVDAGHESAYTRIAAADGIFEDKNLAISELPAGTVFQHEVAADLPRASLALLSRAVDQHVYALCAPSYLADLLRPYYMRKSQAERMKEASRD